MKKKEMIANGLANTGEKYMEWLTGNSFFLLVLLVCVGMHFFGHGHGHGHDDHRSQHDKHADDSDAHAEHNPEERII